MAKQIADVSHPTSTVPCSKRGISWTSHPEPTIGFKIGWFKRSNLPVPSPETPVKGKPPFTTKSPLSQIACPIIGVVRLLKVLSKTTYYYLYYLFCLYHQIKLQNPTELTKNPSNAPVLSSYLFFSVGYLLNLSL